MTPTTNVAEPVIEIQATNGTPMNSKQKRAARKAKHALNPNLPTLPTMTPPEELAKLRAEISALQAKAKVTKEAVAKEPRPETKTRRYYGGAMVAKYGTKFEITDAIVAEVDALFGDVNPRESHNEIRHAQHAVRGYLAAKAEAKLAKAAE